MKRFCNLILFTAACTFAASTSVAANKQPVAETKTKIRVEKNGIWLESEISPSILTAVLPALDSNRDLHLSEEELSNGYEEILAYYARLTQVECDGLTLVADSTYFAFRSPAVAESLPDRFYIYHWYAVLRQPSRLRIKSKLFHEFGNETRHKGMLISRSKILEFKFPTEAQGAAASQDGFVEFEFTSQGTPSLVEWTDDITRAGYVWIGAGVCGLLILRIAAAARKRRRNSQSIDQEEEESMPEALFNESKAVGKLQTELS